jgi:Alw26I/Eco31I/Esp3I family type II restriction m6 adenine DNA methyltransferase
MKELKRVLEVDNSEQRKNLYRRALGRFYTHDLVAGHMIDSLLACVPEAPGQPLRVVEPFAGDGRLIARLLEASDRRPDLRTRQWIFHLWDCDEKTLPKAESTVYDAIANAGVDAEVNTLLGDVFDIARDYLGRFHLCVTNPPWEVLKPDARELRTLPEEQAKAYKEFLQRRSKELAALYPHSIPSRRFAGWGMNLARCGVELSLRLVAEGGVCAVVSPASLLGDQVSEPLREWVFESFHVSDVAYYVPEARLYDAVDQASITMVAIKAPPMEYPPTLTIYDRRHRTRRQVLSANEWRALKEEGYTFPLQFGLPLLDSVSRLRHLPRFGELEGEEADSLWAGRELDETGHKRYLADEGSYAFLKGRMLKRFGLVERPTQYVHPDGPSIPRSADFHRVAWRDVSRLSQKRRMHAAIIPPGVVTGNSLHVTYYRDDDLTRLRALLGVMNSLVFEAQARMNLSTSHLSLGAVRKVRVPPLEQQAFVKRLADLVARVEDGIEDAEVELEVEVAKLYGLTLEEFQRVAAEFALTQEERQKLVRHEAWSREMPGGAVLQVPLRGADAVRIPNHYAPTLSDLDKEIIRWVPPGGNWKDIPETVPSRRLEAIRRSYEAGEGSRSTYYGRLHPDAPSYTINTYFSRPGNGCHIHCDETQGRTLSQREAARLQSFPDSYRFQGSRSAIDRQIGNAVPPLLAFQIARHLSIQGCFIDLFAGAGGLSLGFTWAGWKPIVANDIDKHALTTYALNLHDQSILGDIRDSQVVEQIITAARTWREQAPSTPLLVLGGPPCQGFSTAGNRRSLDDERNWLFKQYKTILEEIHPDGFIFENVMGLLNMEQGRVFEMIRTELLTTANKLHVWRLHAERYAVPQRRQRVFLIGDNTGQLPEAPPMELTYFGNTPGLFDPLAPAVTVWEALGDLPPLRPGEDGSHLPYRHGATHPYQQLMRGLITPESYLGSVQRRLEIDAAD